MRSIYINIHILYVGSGKNYLYDIFVVPKSCFMDVDKFSPPQNLMRSEENSI